MEAGATAASREQLSAWAHLSEVNMVSNTLAALEYGRFHALLMVCIAILTVVVGSQGVAALVAPNRTALEVVSAVCQVCLGAFTAVHAVLDLKPKSAFFHQRAAGYARLANDIRATVLSHATTADAAVDALLSEIPGRMQNLEQATDPLPLRFRRNARSLLSVVGGSASPPAAPLSASEGDAAILLVAQQVATSSLPPSASAIV